MTKFVPSLVAALGVALLIPLSAQAAQSFPDPAVDASLSAAKGSETAVLAGGCFWGVEAVFDHLKGVKSVVAGFSGGSKSTAHYETVSTGRTGHAESVKITYDPSRITYGQLLKIFFSIAHDPTELNRQGPDEGTQYRSAVFYINPEQKKVAEAYIQQLDQAHLFRHPIVTQVIPFQAFYAAEDYHQRFVARNPTYPYVVYNDLPKLGHLKKEYPELYRR